MKVAVVVPSGDQVHSRFMVSLVSLFQYSERSGLDLVIINPRSSLIGTGRGIGVDEALSRNVDYILFIDSDMVFPHTTLTRLLAHDKAIVGATYVKRVLPTSLVHAEMPGADWDGDPEVGYGLREVARLPAGLLLIRADVFDGAERPYFRCSYPGDGLEHGEDYWFCDEARKRGFEIWLDSDLSRAVGHLGVYTHTYHDL